MLQTQQSEMAEVQKMREAQRRRLLRANQTKRTPSWTSRDAPSSGKKTFEMQTESYLEELVDKTIDFEADGQADNIDNRPPSPLFCPAQIGKNAVTQVERGELFDFDAECEPVLEVLVGRTLQLAMMEVLEEEELAALARHQAEFMKQREFELVEVQKIVAAEKRKQDEIFRRTNQQAARREQDLSMMRKVASRCFASLFLSSQKKRELATLLDAGVFQDHTQQTAESSFVPKLFDTVAQKVEELQNDRTVLTDVMQSTVSRCMEPHTAAVDKERARITMLEDAIRKVRKERMEEDRFRKEEVVRIAKEQDDMKLWEQTQPPPPEFAQIVSCDAAEGTATLGDGRVAYVDPDEMELLQTQLAVDGQTTMGRVVASESTAEEAYISVTDFRPAEEEEVAAAAAAAAAQ